MSTPNGQPGWETSDAPTRPLFLFLAGLTALIAVSFFVTSWVLGGLEEEHAAEAQTHPMEGFQTRPNGPLLQAKPTTELADHKRYEDELLGRFAWVDPHDGIIRVPITHAMDLLLERGVPVRPREEGR